MSVTFESVLQQAEGMNATGIPVPPHVVDQLASGKRPKVVVTVNGYAYRSTVGAYGDVFMLPFAKEHRDASGVQAGDPITVTLELDSSPRTVDVPDDLAAALAAHPGARDIFDALSYTLRKEHVRQVESAKAAETRARRIAAIVAKVTS
ncbi:MAG: DUF1905 domain-containing protein [Chloroflexi bacterium]|nr:DUF1905 domain-containing protein [Chloroflexota bacterium]